MCWPLFAVCVCAARLKFKRKKWQKISGWGKCQRITRRMIEWISHCALRRSHYIVSSYFFCFSSIIIFLRFYAFAKGKQENFWYSLLFVLKCVCDSEYLRLHTMSLYSFEIPPAIINRFWQTVYVSIFKMWSS